jgi:hypothetical protein
MTQEQEPLHERVLEFAPLYLRLVLSDLGTWLRAAPSPSICDIQVLIPRAGPVVIKLTGKTSLVEVEYARLLKHLRVEL